MPEPAATLMILVEAALALAGFSGVVVVFGRRSAGVWSELERTRLINLLVSGFSVLFLSLAALLLLHARVAPAMTWRIGSGAFLLLMVYRIIQVPRRLRSTSTDPQRPGIGLILFSSGGHAIVILANLGNLVVLGEFWPFLAALVWSFGLGCAIFAQLLLLVKEGGQAA